MIDMKKQNTYDYVENQKFNFGIYSKDGKIISSNIDNNNNNNDELKNMLKSEDNNSNVSVNDINMLNIIIDDSDCSDNFFDEICKILSDDGLKFKVSKNGNGVNVGNSVVITLDQQYSSGFESIVFAPFDNARVGESDALALSIQSAFKNINLSTGNISCGKVGYRISDDGNVSNIVPTSTEEAIDENHDTSFVTISLGTQTIEPDDIAKCIENGLARYVCYINNYDSQTDLIYRSTDGESVEMVSNYFASTPESLSFANNLTNKETLDAQAIVNPVVKDLDVFNHRIDYSIIKDNQMHL